MPAVRKLKIENGDFEDSGKNILHMGSIMSKMEDRNGHNGRNGLGEKPKTPIRPICPMKKLCRQTVQNERAGCPKWGSTLCGSVPRLRVPQIREGQGGVQNQGAWCPKYGWKLLNFIKLSCPPGFNFKKICYLKKMFVRK